MLRRNLLDLLYEGGFEDGKGVGQAEKAQRSFCAYDIILHVKRQPLGDHRKARRGRRHTGRAFGDGVANTGILPCTVCSCV